MVENNRFVYALSRFEIDGRAAFGQFDASALVLSMRTIQTESGDWPSLHGSLLDTMLSRVESQVTDPKETVLQTHPKKRPASLLEFVVIEGCAPGSQASGHSRLLLLEHPKHAKTSKPMMAQHRLQSRSSSAKNFADDQVHIYGH